MIMMMIMFIIMMMMMMTGQPGSLWDLATAGSELWVGGPSVQYQPHPLWAGPGGVTGGVAAGAEPGTQSHPAAAAYQPDLFGFGGQGWIYCHEKEEK